jgi:hypothetical protein
MRQARLVLVLLGGGCADCGRALPIPEVSTDLGMSGRQLGEQARHDLGTAV